MAKSKIKLSMEFLVICDYAVISKENKLSILGIFDQIFVNNLPSRHTKMFVVGILRGEPNAKHSLSMQLTDPSGKNVLPKQDMQVTLGASGNSNLLAELNNLPLNLTGSYTIELLADRKSLAKKNFNVFRSPGTGDQPKPQYKN